MIFIFGVKNVEENFRKIGFECTGCLNETVNIVTVRKVLELFLIPVFTLKKSYFIECPTCRSTYKLKNSKIDDLLTRGKVRYEDVEKIVREA
nr:zinc-ribbon domain-containing protein [uncultured Cetobacterium sp.]